MTRSHDLAPMETIGKSTIYLGDCLQILPGLEPGFSALITDPPYSSGGRTAGERQHPPSEKYKQAGTHAPWAVDFEGEMMDARSWAHWCVDWLSTCRHLVVPGGYAMVFTDWRQLPALTDAIQISGWQWRGVVAWDKGLGARGPHKGYFRHQCEYIVWASNGHLPASSHGGPWPGCIHEPVRASQKLHMTGKPVELMEQLVQVAKPGGRILDPFMGSASTLMACEHLGYSGTGIEQTRYYYDVSRNRLRDALK